jgi:hypothetical protein
VSPALNLRESHETDPRHHANLTPTKTERIQSEESDAENSDKPSFWSHVFILEASGQRCGHPRPDTLRSSQRRLSGQQAEFHVIPSSAKVPGPSMSWQRFKNSLISLRLAASSCSFICNLPPYSSRCDSVRSNSTSCRVGGTDDVIGVRILFSGSRIFLIDNIATTQTPVHRPIFAPLRAYVCFRPGGVVGGG